MLTISFVPSNDSDESNDVGCRAHCLFSSCGSDDPGATCSCSWGMCSTGMSAVFQPSFNHLSNLNELLNELETGKYDSKALVVSVQAMITYYKKSMKNSKIRKKPSKKMALLQKEYLKNIQLLNEEEQSRLNHWIFVRTNKKTQMKESKAFRINKKN